MVDYPALYYANVVQNYAKALPLLASYVLVLITIMVKPGWCQDESGESLCKLDAYPTMLHEDDMWSPSTGLGLEAGCSLVLLAVFYVDRLHRGPAFYDTTSAPTKLLWAKFAVVGLYVLDIIFASIFEGSSSYQVWRFGPYLRIAIFVLVHRNTFAIWKLHVTMLPHLFEVLIVLVSFLFFFAILAMNIFQKGDEGNAHFQSLGGSLWSLVVLLTTANFPGIFVDSFLNSRISVVYFIAFVCLGVYGKCASAEGGASHVGIHETLVLTPLRAGDVMLPRPPLLDDGDGVFSVPGSPF